MFGIGSWELILIAALAIIILGPERCIDTFKSAGKLWRHIRAELASAKDVLEDHDDKRS